MYILGATILLSGFIFSKGQSINSTELVYASTFVPFDSSFMVEAVHIIKHKSSIIETRDEFESNLATLLIKDLSSLGQDNVYCTGDPDKWNDEQIYSCLGHVNEELIENFI